MAYPVEDLAAYVKTQLPDGINVYDHASDVVKYPAVVFVPGNPAIAVVSQDAHMTLAWSIEATLVTTRAKPKYGTREIVDLWRQVVAAVTSYTEAVTVLTLEDIGQFEDGAGVAGVATMILTQKEGT